MQKTGQIKLIGLFFYKYLYEAGFVLYNEFRHHLAFRTGNPIKSIKKIYFSLK